MPELDMSDVKPTVLSALIVFLLVLITVPLAKWAMTRYPVPYLAPLVLSI